MRTKAQGPGLGVVGDFVLISSIFSLWPKRTPGPQQKQVSDFDA